MVKVTNFLLLATDEGLVSAPVLLDISAGFDTIEKSNPVTMRGTFDWHLKELHWTGSSPMFLIDYNVMRVSSVWAKLSCGVPQGSMLRPILFTLTRHVVCTNKK